MYTHTQGIFIPFRHEKQRIFKYIQNTQTNHEQEEEIGYIGYIHYTCVQKNIKTAKQLHFKLDKNNV